MFGTISVSFSSLLFFLFFFVVEINISRLNVITVNSIKIVVRVKENFEISLLGQMDEYSKRLNRSRMIHFDSNQRFTILRCYCHLIDQINIFSQTLGKDGKFQLFICLAARYK